MRNPIVRKGEHGGFKWKFRRFWLELETLSGNFKCRFTAAEAPYGYLLAGKGDENIEGFAATLYEIGMLLTTDQTFVDDIQGAIRRYEQRLGETELEKDGEEAAIAEERALQEHLELPKKERRKAEKRIDKEFKKTVKKAKNEEKVSK